MTDTSRHIAKTRTDSQSGWEAYPLPKDTIVKGEPGAMVHWARVQADPPYYAGVWTVQPCTFDFAFEMNETAHVLEGHVVVTQQDGPTLELRAGDVATFPKGAKTRWEVRAPFKKIFVDTP